MSRCSLVTSRAQFNRASQNLGKCPRIGKLYTFKLRKNVKFHNGEEMTADDIKFALDYTLNPKNGAYGLEDLNAVERAEVADKYTLKIHMKRHNPLFLTLLTEIRSFSAIPNESLPEGLQKADNFSSRHRSVQVRRMAAWASASFLNGTTTTGVIKLTSIASS